MGRAERQAAPAAASNPHAWADIGAWNVYFLAKLALGWMGVLNLHVLPNLLLLAVLLLPLPWRRVRLLRTVLAVPAGIVLLYHDTWWPPFQRLLAQPGVLDFSWQYLVELAGRFVNWSIVGVLALAVTAYVLLRPWVRMTTLSVLGVLGLAASQLPWPAGWSPATRAMAAADVPVHPGEPAQTRAAGPADSATLNAWLADFYAKEARRQTRFPAAAPGAAPFDVIVLNICSLAWSDLDEVKLRHNPLFDRMDVVFDRFNSATAYSGPAAIRLLRASCGQTPHSALFDPAPGQCHLFDNLRQLGFGNELAMNHDGHFDDFIGELHQYGGLQAAPLDINAMPRAYVAFDGSPLRRDRDVLLGWWQHRLNEPSSQVALFYNTITLHDGNRTVGPDGRTASGDYRLRADAVLGDIAALIDTIGRSGRRAMVVVVPEHGAALHGDRMQIPGMREIPSPSITQVPVGVKLVGMGPGPVQGPMHVSGRSSFLAVSELVSRVYAANAAMQAGQGPDWKTLLDGLPITDAVSENEGAKVITYGDRPYLQLQGSNDWAPYPQDTP